MAECEIDASRNIANRSYGFRLEIVIDEDELKDLEIEHLNQLALSLESDAKVSLKLAVMAELFKQLGR